MLLKILKALLLLFRLTIPVLVSLGFIDLIVFCDDAGVLGEKTDPNSSNRKPLYFAVFFIVILISILGYKYSGTSPDISSVVQTTNIDLYDPQGHTGGPRPGKD